jgi:hypothetical protein
MEKEEKLPTIRTRKDQRDQGKSNRRRTNCENVEVDRHCSEKDEGTSWGFEVDAGRSSGGLRMCGCSLGLPPERECQRSKFEGRRRAIRRNLVIGRLE